MSFEVAAIHLDDRASFATTLSIKIPLKYYQYLQGRAIV